MTRLDRFRMYQRVSRHMVREASRHLGNGVPAQIRAALAHPPHALVLLRAAVKYQRFAWTALFRRPPTDARQGASR